MEEEMAQLEAECTMTDTTKSEFKADKPDNSRESSEEPRENHGSGAVDDGESNDGTDDERSLPLTEFYPYIRCALCNGFFIDATTITECLHTFCKSCIVKHFFYSNRCPNCNIVVHQTQPLYNIRGERTDVCFLQREGAGVAVSPAVKSSKQKKDLMPQSVFTIPSELDVSLVLEFVGAEEGIENYKPLERKYVRVSGEATIRHVELFIRRKMELNSGCQVDVVCGEHLLDRYQSLREVQNSMGESVTGKVNTIDRYSDNGQSSSLVVSSVLGTEEEDNKCSDVGEVDKKEVCVEGAHCDV
ncbi:hypothetical protein JZ751_027307 [Albula glossodonta]|uniref:Polycomb group RING finger protein 6 n=1 Tax=Albula glossodonta TaxID=121402 RepID=A0A8T2NF90_9TELE|nr:hypothetical protein JZ751_027307 [Albula glossodonta]